MNDMRIVESGLIPVYEQNGENAVDARELHEFLGVGKDFLLGLKIKLRSISFKKN